MYIPESRKQAIRTFAQEFRDNYLLAPKGQRHLSQYQREKNELSKGIKSGFVSPTLFFLNPTYRIINFKTILTVNFILEKKTIDRDLTNYMKYVSVIDELIPELDIDIFSEPEKFDMFCHFMCDKRLGGYAKFIGKSSKEEIIEEVIDEEVINVLDNEFEPRGHWEVIYYITQIGKLL